jgi:hypothetical protein
VDHDPACFTVHRDDSSRNVTAESGERADSRDVAGDAAPNGIGSVDARGALVPTTSDEALRLAIKLAVNAGEYERAAALLEVAKRTRKLGNVTPIDSAREREPKR